MIETVPFKARARTVDHLGREQIADCPTAVSELWKNAYDAYARSVSLHIFDGSVPVAAVLDSGHGMNKREFIERWLTIGTESKAQTREDASARDRDGLPPRPRQGQKGIGRLSTAFLGPVCLIVSKREGDPFTAALVDWRIFQNPYLNLDDVGIPVEQFQDRVEFLPLLDRLADALVDNVWGRAGTEDRNKRVNAAWKRLDSEATKAGAPKPSEIIVNSALAATLADRHLSQWSVWNESAKHGTALFVFGIGDELTAWFRDPQHEDPEQNSSVDLLRNTLTGFVDPYDPDKPEFSYAVVVHQGETARTVISDAQVFSLPEFTSLEHTVEGRFGPDGTFVGRVKAFGRNSVEFTHTPQRPVPQGGPGHIGAFGFCIGTFEQELSNSTHTPEQHGHLKDLTPKYAGLKVYRDALRVMPYGRPDADYFGIEERRSQHAGREFWAHRRSFGRVALTRSGNPNLRDKAGREGLIDNKARRELRILVIDLLKATARRFFGSDAELRQEVVPELRAKHARAQASRQVEEAARKGQLKRFRDALRASTPTLARALLDATALAKQLERAAAQRDGPAITRLGEELRRRQQATVELKLPERPARLGHLEADYRAYRDQYRDLVIRLESLLELWSAASAKAKLVSPSEQVAKAIKEYREYLGQRVAAWQGEVRTALQGVGVALNERMRADLERFDAEAAAIAAEWSKSNGPVGDTLKALLAARDSAFGDLSLRYAGRIRSVEHLAKDVDIEAALLWSSEERAELTRRVDQLNGLAQLGITVEIIGHEFNALDSEVKLNLEKFPANVRQLAAYRNTLRAYRSLVDRLRFLSPVRLAGPRLAEKITGNSIFEYVSSFFEPRLTDDNVTLEATEAFRQFSVTEYTSRIYPVFVNLLNNSLYWLRFAKLERRIVLDAIGDGVVVNDSGPGVDPDDVQTLFSLFFTRRVEGRGVGLYLCRVNLAAGGHTIAYTNDPKYKRLPGAAFMIRFSRPTTDD